MKLLYLSVLASKSAIEEARLRDPKFSAYATQKFNRLVTEGFVRNGHSVKALSTFYQPNIGIGYCRKDEQENGISYSYIPSFNFRPFRVLWITVYCFSYVFIWGMRNKRQKAVICDVLNVSACMGAVTAARLINLRCVGVMTDMPGIGVGATSSAKTQNKLSFASRVNRSYLKNFSHYVFLTKQMNEAVNKKHRPYIVMEGLVDADMIIPGFVGKDEKRVVLYAGGLYERYGLKLLVEAFIKANVDNSELWLYGKGPFTEELPAYHKRDSRIVYKGIQPNDKVVKAELRATLLVNPRPTCEEFAKYSFPSKNMEYMVSGTPVLTTRLPGMPIEYYPHVYLFDKGESVEGYTEALKKVLSLSAEELDAKGNKARTWVLTKKNNVSQTKRIIELITQKYGGHES